LGDAPRTGADRRLAPAAGPRYKPDVTAVPDAPVFRADELPAAAAVVIVGAGFAGAATAWALAEAGVSDVVILEREAAPGRHATGRNAALCRQLADDDDTTAYTVRGAAFLREPPPGFSDRALVTRTGSILTADDQAGVDALVARARGAGIACERVELGDVVARWPRLAGFGAAGGIYVPGDGVIDIAALLAGYLDGARRRGARVVTGCEVTGAVAGAGGVRLATTRGPIAAAVVVDAAGAWAGVVGDRLGAGDTHFTPIKRHLFRSAPVAVAADAPFVWHLGAAPIYVRPLGDGLMLSHCDSRDHAPADVTADGDAIERLGERVRAMAPGLADVGIAEAWACLRTFTPSHRFRIERDAALPWLVWVAALGGHGVTASAAVGTSAAGVVAAALDAR
jgi:glycine/D-amino acid oxidase-like deaminating enzyme